MDPETYFHNTTRRLAAMVKKGLFGSLDFSKYNFIYFNCT